MIAGGARSGQPLGLALGVVLAPVAAIVGAVVGAARAHTVKEVNAAQSAMTKALGELDFENRLRDRFVEIARRDTRFAVEAHPKSDHRASFHHLAQQRQTVLALDARLGFGVFGRIDPDITPIVLVRGRVIRTSDDRVLYKRLWCAKGEKSTYFELAKNDAAALRSIASRLVDTITVHMVHDLFIATSTNSMSSLRSCGLRARPLSTEKTRTRTPAGTGPGRPVSGRPVGRNPAVRQGKSTYMEHYCAGKAVAFCLE
jgi:hypothetical protein